MHYFLTFCFVFMSIVGNAVVYYVSSSGNDSNPGTNPDQPWKSLTKVNSFTPSPGDQILFKRGDSWSGTLTVKSSGTANSPIVYGDYGTGEKPRIYGSEPVTGWTLHSGNIWKATVNSKVTQLFIDNVRMKLARHPNTGYINITSKSGSKTLSCTTLDKNINYTGALWTGRTSPYKLMTHTIISSSGQSLQLDAEPASGLTPGNGFYLFNKLEFLDSPGEWYYDSTTRTIYLWTPNGNSPHTEDVRGSVRNEIILVDRKNYVTIHHLDLRQPIQRGVVANLVSYLILDNLSISSTEMEGILIANGNSHHNIIRNNEIDGANDSGIKFNSSYSTVTDNKITNTAMFENLGLLGLRWEGAGRAMDVKGNGNVLRYNVIENSGYLGIALYEAPNTTIEYNYIKNTCLMKDDGGGIYMWEANFNNIGCSGTIIRGNIVSGCVGTREGLTGAERVAGYGIYLDRYSQDILVENNTSEDCGGANIFLHTVKNCTIKNNVLFKSRNNLLISGEHGGTEISNNIIYAAKTADWDWPRCVKEVDGDATFRNNKYIAHYYEVAFNTSGEDYTFDQWIIKKRNDTGSTIDVSALKTGEKEELFYNETKQEKTISLGNAVYKNLDGKEVSGSITLEPFTSQILIKTTKISDANQKPVIPGQSFNIQENKEANDFVGKVNANDPDIGQELQFAIVPESDLFVIDAISGEIFVKKKLAITKDTTIVLSIVATDNGTPPSSATSNVTINLIDLSPDQSEYLFEETAGIIVADTKGNNDGTIVNNAIRTHGIVGGGLEFTGSNYVSAGQIFGSNVSNEVSISAWLKPTGIQGEYQGIVVHGGSNTYSYALYISPDTKTIGFVTSGTTASWQSVANVEQLWDGNWHQITTTYNGLEKVIYLNGTPIAQIDAIGQIESGAGFNLLLGAGRDQEPPSFLYKGLMDQVRVCNYALTAEQVNEQYKIDAKIPVYTSEEITICDGETYQNWMASGKYERVLLTAYGADSTVTTNLRVNPTKYSTETITIRSGESYLGWTKTGSFNRILTSFTGCDSIVTTNLNVVDHIITTENISICEGSSYQGWSQQGQYQRVLPAASGADSIVVTNLWINPVKYSEEEVLIVQGESYSGWFETGEYQRTLPAVSGCDSIVTTVLTVVSSEPTVEDIYICEGSSYQSWTSEGHYQRTLKTASGADSIVITNLWVNPINYTTEHITIKEGESYKGWTKSGVYENKLPSNSGCDSIVVTNMTVLKSIHIAEEVTICEGSAYLNWSKPGQYQRTLSAATGADSIVSTLLWVNPAIKTSEEISILKGESYMGWSVSGTYSRTLNTTEGCDSIVVTNLHIIDDTNPNPGASERKQSIDLRKGWNLVSTYLLPEDPDMGAVNEDIVACNSLIKVQDERGRTFEKWSDQIGWVNNIGDIQNNEGYRVHVRNNCALEIIGEPVNLPLNITLKKGWNLISFPYTGNVNSMVVMQQLIDAGILIKVQDEVGYALEYWGRSFGWMNRLGYFKPGEGYLVKVKQEAILTIGEAYEKSIEIFADEFQIRHFNLAYDGNGSNHMNINIKNLKESGFQVGDEIAAFDNEICVGAIKLSESNFISNVASISASATDSDDFNGFISGHPIELRLWDSVLDSEHQLTAEILEGEMTFNQRASVFVTLSQQIATGINQAKMMKIEMYPNPAIDQVTIRFSEIPSEKTHLCVLDLTGKELIAREVQSAEELLDIRNFMPGMYLVKTLVGNQVKTKKLIVQ